MSRWLRTRTPGDGAGMPRRAIEPARRGRKGLAVGALSALTALSLIAVPGFTWAEEPAPTQEPTAAQAAAEAPAEQPQNQAMPSGDEPSTTPSTTVAATTTEPTTPAEETPAAEPTTPAGDTPAASTPTAGKIDVDVPRRDTTGLGADAGIAPMQAFTPDGGTAPYVYWDVRDTDNNLVPGATFKFQYRSSSSWQTGSDASALSDCNGACPTSTSGDSLDRDSDGGEFLLEHRGTPRTGISTTGNRLSATGNYRVSQVTAPAGYEWVATGDNTKTIGNSNSNTATWNNANGTGTHNFGTFLVRKLQILPLCTAGYVYAIGQTGQMQQVAPDGTVTKVGTPASGVTAFNGLGIGYGGTPVFAYERSGSDPSVSTATIWKYDTVTGNWTSTGVSVDSKTSSRTIQFVAGAVNLDNGRYYLGGFATNGNVFRIWEYNPATNAVVYKGHINTPGGSSVSGANNGDIAFDAAGTLYVVRGTGSTTTVFSVLKTDLDAANGGSTAIPASQAASRTTMDNVNGVAFDASGKAYLGATSEMRSYNMPDWAFVANVTSNLSNSGDLASCSSPPTVMIQKEIVGGRVNPGDQFKMTLHKGATLLGDATTTGSSIGVQSERIGPLPTVRGVQLTFAETGAGGASLTNYASAYQCTVTYLDGTVTVLDQVNGTSGTITIPPTGEAVRCVFRNSPLVANVTIHKDVTDVNGVTSPRQGWTVGAVAAATTGTVTKAPAADTQSTNASGDAAWKLTFGTYASRATVNVSETMQDGYEFVSGQCVITSLDGSETTTTMAGPGASALTGVKPGDQVNCTYTNKQKAGAVTWNKVDDATPAQLLGGSAWTITGPGFIAPDNVVTDCVTAPCTGFDQDPVAGQFRLTGLAWGSYTVTETTTPQGHTGAVTFTFVVNAANAGTDLVQGNKVNVRQPASVAWNKVDDSTPAQPLGGSVWTITGPNYPDPGTDVADCIAANVSGCTGLDRDPAAGQFQLDGLTWGDYTVTEKTPPAGHTGSHSFSFTVDQGNAGTVITASGSPFVNPRIPGHVTWSKVDATDSSLLAGSAWTVVGPEGPQSTSVVVTDCDADDAADCTGDDKDPVAGQFQLAGLAWGKYTVTETTVPAGYTGVAGFTFEITAANAAAGVTMGALGNDRVRGTVIWSKVDDGATLLPGSEWELTGPGTDGETVVVTDCLADSAADCEGPDQDPAAGRFSITGLAWGDYTLVETKAPPGYVRFDTEYAFTIGRPVGDEVKLVWDLGQIKNHRPEGPVLPLTGGFGRDHVYIAGAFLLLLALAAYGTTKVRGRRNQGIA